MWSPSCILASRVFNRHRLQDQSAADRVRHRAVYRRRDNSRFRSPTRPPGSFNGPEGGKSLFSFNRTSGSCWRCKPVCRVKASIPGAIWATPPAPLPPRLRGHLRLQHRPPKFASSVTRLGESAAFGSRLVESFLTGLSCSQQNFAGPTNSAALPSWGVGAKNSLARDGPVMPGAKIVNLKGPYPSAGRAQIHKSRAGLRGQTQST